MKDKLDTKIEEYAYHSFQKGNWAMRKPRNEFEQAQSLVDNGFLK